MLEISKTAPNRVELHLEGALDSDAMKTGIDKLFEVSDGVEDGRLFYLITDFQMPTPGALMLEMARLPQLFGLLRHYSKAAVVSDTEWVRNWAEFEGKLFPGIDIRSFEMEERDAAEDWLMA